MPGSHVPARLCPTVEGVEFWIPLPHDRRVRCVITEAALQSHYGADSELPESWIAAFARHRRDIEARALRAAGRREDVHVVLVNDDLGQLRATAGRCISDSFQAPARGDGAHQPKVLSSASQPCDKA